MLYLRTLVLSFVLAIGPLGACAQGANVAFGTFKSDPTLPVEVTANTLDVNQATNQAVFDGDVLVTQGEMLLSANHLLVIYKADSSGIERLEATGDVVLVNGPDAAEGDRADYTIDSGIIIMTGNVLATQGKSALTSDRMVVNLITGTANMTGRVKTILQADDKE